MPWNMCTDIILHMEAQYCNHFQYNSSIIAFFCYNYPWQYSPGSRLRPVDKILLLTFSSVFKSLSNYIKKKVGPRTCSRCTNVLGVILLQVCMVSIP